MSLVPYSITCSTKIFTLAIAPFVFSFSCVLCDFAKVPGVHTFFFPQEEEAQHSS